MKKKDILISLAIIFAAVIAFNFLLSRQGHIKIDTAGVEMYLHSGIFSQTKVTSGEGPLRLKARSYQAKRVTIEKKDNSDRWRIYATGPSWGKLKRIKVGANETTSVELGPPLIVRPRVSPRRKYVSIGLEIIGKAGEHYSPRVAKNARALPVPGLKIVDEQGKTLAVGKFAYG